MPTKKKRSIKITKTKVKEIKSKFQKMLSDYTSQESEVESLILSVSQALDRILEGDKETESHVTPLMEKLVNPNNITTTGSDVRKDFAYHIRTSAESSKSDPT